MKYMINLWLTESNIAREFLVVAFMANDRIYAVTEVNQVIRLYRSDLGLPVLKSREEGLQQGLLHNLHQIIANADDQHDVVLGDIGQHARELMLQANLEIPDAYKLRSLDAPIKRFFNLKD